MIHAQPKRQQGITSILTHGRTRCRFFATLSDSHSIVTLSQWDSWIGVAPAPLVRGPASWSVANLPRTCRAPTWRQRNVIPELMNCSVSRTWGCSRCSSLHPSCKLFKRSQLPVPAVGVQFEKCLFFVLLSSSASWFFKESIVENQAFPDSWWPSGSPTQLALKCKCLTSHRWEHHLEMLGFYCWPKIGDLRWSTNIKCGIF